MPFEIIYHICSLCGDDDHRGTFLLRISIAVKKDELDSPKKQTRSDLGKYQNDKILFAAPFLNLSMLTRANLGKHLYILFIVPTSLGKGSYQGESVGNSTK